MNKKGLSDVVITVLIILFGIFAVAVIGSILFGQIVGVNPSIDSFGEDLCIYKIPNEMKFTCSNKTVTSFELSLFKYQNALDLGCEDVSNLFEKNINTSHYEIAECNLNVSFPSKEY